MKLVSSTPTSSSSSFPQNLIFSNNVDEADGGVAGLKHVEVPVPEPKTDELLIKLEAASLNSMDCKTQKGVARPILPRKFPTIPGSFLCTTLYSLSALEIT